MYIASLVITINLVYCYIFLSTHIFPHLYHISSSCDLLCFYHFFEYFFSFHCVLFVFLVPVYPWPFCQSQSHTTRISYNYIRRIFFIETQRTRLVFNLFYGRGKLYQILLLSSIKILLFVEYCRICLYDLIKRIFGDFLIYSRFSHIRYLNFSGVFLSFLY